MVSTKTTKTIWIWERWNGKSLKEEVKWGS